MDKTTETTKSSLLEDFKFDNDETFFGQKVSENDADNIKEIKNNGVINDGKPSSDTESIKGVKTKEEEEEEEEEPIFFKSDKKKPKEKVKQDEIDEDGENSKEDIEEIKPKKSKSSKTKEEELEEDNENKESNIKKEEDNDDDEDDEDKKDDKFYSTLARELKDRSILDIDIPEDKNLTEEEFFELQNKDIETKVEEALESLFEGLDQDARDFIKFKKNGGNTHDFFTQYADVLDIPDFDENDKSHQDKVLSHYLTTIEKLDGEEFDDRMKYIKEGGKAKIYTSKWYKEIQEEQQEEKEALKKVIEKANKKRQDDDKAFRDALTEVANKTEAVGIFTFSKLEQKKLTESITKPTVKIGKNKYVPSFQAKLSKVLNAASTEDKQKLLLLAKLVEDDFKIDESIMIKKKTEVAREAKSKLRDAKSGVRAHTSGGKKQLSDFFTD